MASVYLFEFSDNPGAVTTEANQDDTVRKVILDLHSLFVSHRWPPNQIDRGKVPPDTQYAIALTLEYYLDLNDDGIDRARTW
jgi:hypothetical protein